MNLIFSEGVLQSEIDSFFKEDPTLAYLALSDNDLCELYETKSLAIKDSSVYFKVCDGSDIVSIIKCEKFSEMAVCAHVYVASRYHHKGVYPKVCDLLVDYLLEHTGFTKVVLTVPKPCEHVSKAAIKYGMRLEAELKDIVIWRQKVVNLLYYILDIR